MNLKVLVSAMALIIGASTFAQTERSTSADNSAATDTQEYPGQNPHPLPPPPPPPPPPPHPPHPHPRPPAGIVTTIVSNSASGSGFGTPVLAVVDCGEGMVVTGGGVNCQVAGTNDPAFSTSSCPTTNSTIPAACDVANGSSTRYWRGSCFALSDTELTTTAYAVCAPLASKSGSGH